MKRIDVPPVWLGVFAAAAWLQQIVVPAGPAVRGLSGLGTFLVVAGVLLIALAAWQFRRHRTTIIPHETPVALIDTGVYAYSRNPIYLADTLILTGLVLRWAAWPSLVLVPVFVWVITVRFIRGEEARLAGQFPEEFSRYVEKVRRWA